MKCAYYGNLPRLRRKSPHFYSPPLKQTYTPHLCGRPSPDGAPNAQRSDIFALCHTARKAHCQLLSHLRVPAPTRLGGQRETKEWSPKKGEPPAKGSEVGIPGTVLGFPLLLSQPAQQLQTRLLCLVTCYLAGSWGTAGRERPHVNSGLGVRFPSLSP